MIKTAIALYVRNEASDIAGWLAYHFAIGINTIFVFDDQSNDGTYEIIKSAANVFDVRYFRTDRDTITDHDVRHRKSLEYACTLAKGEFDWIGFLDADEYFYYEDETIEEFFSRLHNFEGIAINWCIYGSSGRVVKPRMPTVDAFRYRSKENFSENVLVKSFIRPDKFGDHYHGPHRFFGVADDKYADPNGEIIRWDASTNKNVSWKNARIMHFVCRSMEHYVERIKRRLGVDLSDSMAYWDLFNRNDEFDFCAERFLKSTYKNIALIQESAIKSNFINKLSNSDRGAKHALEKIHLSMKTDNKKDIYFNIRSKRIVFADETYNEADFLLKLDFFIVKGFPDFLHISFYDKNSQLDYFPLTLEGDRRQSFVLTYKIDYDKNRRFFSMRDPNSNTYIKSDNCLHQSEGLLKTGQRFKDHQCNFILFGDQNIVKESEGVRYLSYIDFLNTIRKSAEGIDVNDCIALANMMDEKDKATLETNFPGIFKAEL